MDSRLLFGLAALSLSVGCVTFKQLGTSLGGVGGGATPEEVKAAIKAEDYPKLKDLCNEVTPIKSDIANYHGDACEAAIRIAEAQDDAEFLKPLCGKRKESFGSHYKTACPAMLRLAVKRNDQAHLRFLCEHDQYDDACRTLKTQGSFADLANPDCSTLAGRVSKARNDFLASDKATAEELGRVVGALARCGEGKMIFESLAHIGDPGLNGYGTQVLLTAEKEAGPALFTTFEKYTKEYSGSKFLGVEHGQYAANHIAHWLLETKRTDLCKPLVTASQGAKAPVVSAMMLYFQSAECKESTPLAVQLLASDVPALRAEGCETLAQLGDKSHLSKLSIVAETDTSYAVEERPEGSGVFVKDYFVADACRRAIGKIKLRSE
jgi:hypothetical protein